MTRALMPVARPFLPTFCLAGAVVVSACAGDSRGAGPTSPTTVASPPTAPVALLVIQVDSICAGRESDIRVFVDAALIGVTNPGEPGVSGTVTLGDHQLSAVSQRGTKWGPFPATVTAAGSIERIGCMPADAL